MKPSWITLAYLCCFTNKYIFQRVVSIVRADKSPYHVSEFTRATHHHHQDPHNTSTHISHEGNDTTMEEEGEDLDEEYLTLDFATMNYDTIQNLQEYVESLQS